MLGLGINTVTDTGWAASSLLNVLAGNFQARVSADGGEVENMVCLNKDLIDLTNGSDSLLIDRYASPAAAYSLRKLRRDYLGPAIRVRRDDDDQELDVFFNSDGSLDTASLEAFCAGTDGYVDTWYDQANGNDATQDEPNQPKIYDSSTGVVTENGKPAMQFDGSATYLLGANKTTIDNTAIFSVIKSDSNTQDCVFIQTSLAAGNFITLGLGGVGSNSAIGSRLAVGGTVVSQVGDSTFTSTDQTLVSYLADNATGQMFIDGTEETDVVGSRNNFITTTIGARGDGLNNFLGKIQEVIFYDSDETSNRTGIESNINDYYNIY
jgi:hypothetical protein